MSERTRNAIVAALGLGAALIVLLYQQVRHLDYVPDLGDPLFSMWRVGWVNHQLFTDPRHLFDANIFYPERLTLTLSDPIVLPALMAAPLLAIGIHPVVVYNLLLLSAFWFSGIAVYLLVERLTASPRAAFIAGLIYASCGYRFHHYSHLELQITQWMPLGLLALHLLISRDSGSGVRDPGSEAVVVRARVRDRTSGAALFLDVLRGVLRRVLRAHRSWPSDRASAIDAATRAASCGLRGNRRDRGAPTGSRVHGSGADEGRTWD